jgi:hypothetical protein
MMAWRILAETHSLKTTVAMMISRMSDTWVQAHGDRGVERQADAASAHQAQHRRLADVDVPTEHRNAGESRQDYLGMAAGVISELLDDFTPESRAAGAGTGNLGLTISRRRLRSAREFDVC